MKKNTATTASIPALTIAANQPTLCSNRNKALMFPNTTAVHTATCSSSPSKTLTKIQFPRYMVLIRSMIMMKKRIKWDQILPIIQQ